MLTGIRHSCARFHRKRLIYREPEGQLTGLAIADAVRSTPARG
jgi:hypothetical protein